MNEVKTPLWELGEKSLMIKILYVNVNIYLTLLIHLFVKLIVSVNKINLLVIPFAVPFVHDCSNF